MRILFAMSMGSFLAVLWVMLSVARRLRAKRRDKIPALAGSAPREFFEAGEYRTPRSLRLVQNTPRLPLAEILFDAPAAAPGRVQAMPAKAAVSLFGVKMDVVPLSAPIASTKEQGNAPSPAAEPRLASIHRFPKPSANRLQSAASKKSPQPERSTLRRLDLSRFGEHTGDLTDPYTRNLTAVARGKWSKGI